MIRALIERQGSLRFIPVDISRSALEESSAALTGEFENLEILAVAGEYGDGLEYLRQHPGGRRLILWLGSNVGNFERDEAAEFIAGVGAAMSPGDRFLAGIDLRKDRAVLEAAYDDSEGVTARFNRNILERINRDLGGRFDLGRFRHRAVWDERLGRVEMHLESAGAQTVPIEGLGLEVGFADGETIHTENSYKYSKAEIEALAAAAEMTLERQWFDSGGRFSVNLFRP